MINDVNEWIDHLTSLLKTQEVWCNIVSLSRPGHPGSGWVIDIDGQRIIAQFVVWPSWTFEASALNIENGEPFYFDNQSQTAGNENLLSAGWMRFWEAISKAEIGEADLAWLDSLINRNRSPEL